MTRFLDGPAAGVTLMLHRAPHYLRAVQSLSSGKWDALDQLTDTPGCDETIVAYEMVGEPTWMHVCRSPRSQSGMYRGGQYKVVDPQPDESAMRSRDLWRAWCAEKVGQPIAEDGTVQPSKEG